MIAKLIVRIVDAMRAPFRIEERVVKRSPARIVIFDSKTGTVSSEDTIY